MPGPQTLSVSNTEAQTPERILCFSANHPHPPPRVLISGSRTALASCAGACVQLVPGVEAHHLFSSSKSLSFCLPWQAPWPLPLSVYSQFHRTRLVPGRASTVGSGSCPVALVPYCLHPRPAPSDCPGSMWLLQTLRVQSMCTYEFPFSLEQGNGVATEDSTMGLVESPWRGAVAAHPGTWAVRAGHSLSAGRKEGGYLPGVTGHGGAAGLCAAGCVPPAKGSGSHCPAAHGCLLGPREGQLASGRAGLRVAPFLGNHHVEHSLFRISFLVLVLVWPWLALWRGAVPVCLNWADLWRAGGDHQCWVFD